MRNDDLHHPAENVARTAGAGPVDACQTIQRPIDGHQARSPILEEGRVGRRMTTARALSFYLPTVADPSAENEQLDFARRTAWRWREFLEAYWAEAGAAR
jgi:hypothetical protein